MARMTLLSSIMVTFTTSSRGIALRTKSMNRPPRARLEVADRGFPARRRPSVGDLPTVGSAASGGDRRRQESSELIHRRAQERSQVAESLLLEQIVGLGVPQPSSIVEPHRSVAVERLELH